MIARAMPDGAPIEQVDSATARTYLANERTYLAWWRSGLAAIATSIAVGRLIPSLLHQTRWPYTVVGAGFALLGVALVIYSAVRARDVRAAVSHGGYVQPRTEVLISLTLITVLLGLALFVLVVANV